MLRVLVCGGRNYRDWERVSDMLDSIHADKGISEIIHGAARGADQLADYWADKNDVQVTRCPADWQRYGRAAGPIRNALMAEDNNPDLVVAFPGGFGTKNMISVAEAAGIEVKILKNNG